MKAHIHNSNPSFHVRADEECGGPVPDLPDHRLQRLEGNSDQPDAISPCVFVVDDDLAARESVCALLSAMNVRSESFASAAAFLSFYRTHDDGPCCLITDVRMSGISGLELQRKLREGRATLPVIVISAYVDVHDTVRAMCEGAVTVLTKPYDDQELWDAVQRALELSHSWQQIEQRKSDILDRLTTLTHGENQVLGLIADGLPNKTVAKRLGISVRTVEDRRARVMRKMKVHSFASLLRLLYDVNYEASPIGNMATEDALASSNT